MRFAPHAVIPAQAGIQSFRQSAEGGRTGYPPPRE